MIDRQFWENAKKVWIVADSPEEDMQKNVSEGLIEPVLTEDSLDEDWIPFDMIDFDGAVQAAFDGGDIPLKSGATLQAASHEPEPEKPKRPKLDTERFDGLLEKQCIPDYVEACTLLRKCHLPEKMDELFASLIERMPILQDAIDKFGDVYHTDMHQFYEYYIPETLQLAAAYLEYLDAGIEEKILQETEKEILDAANKLLLAVNDKIDEIYRFASMELNAKAKALENLMGMNGYVDHKFKIN